MEQLKIDLHLATLIIVVIIGKDQMKNGNLTCLISKETQQDIYFYMSKVLLNQFLAVKFFGEDRVRPCIFPKFCENDGIFSKFNRKAVYNTMYSEQA